MSREREALLRLYGARVELVESLGGMNEAVDAARAAARDPDVFLPDQFSNPANPEAHRTGTGPRDPRRARRQGRRVRRRGGHRRDDHRRGRGAQGAQPRRRP
jgi:cysteine synthase